jgi:AcrR family transcriptional regulator
MSQDSSPVPPADPARKRGRPASTDARARVLVAAHDILMTDGFGRLTVEAAALKSGVSKPTIYRHWANAQELAMAALIARPLPDSSPAASGSAREALARQLGDLIAAFATTRGRQMALTLAAADAESELAKAFRTRVILSSREAGRTILSRALADQEIAALPDVEAALDMIYGALFYRLLAGHRPLTPDLADALVATIWRAP